MYLKGRKLTGHGGITVDKEKPSRGSRGIPCKFPWVAFLLFYMIFLGMVVALVNGHANRTTSILPVPTYNVVDCIKVSTPSVVQINTPRGGAGSGVIVDANGLIITCKHLFSMSPTKVIIKFSDGDTVESTDYWTDLHTDLGYVRIKTLKPLKAAPIATHFPEVGEMVIAIGGPARFYPTASPGYVTALDVDCSVDERMRNESKRFGWKNMVQTNTPSVHGQSGGGLFDLHGRLVGITTTIRTPSMWFSVPYTKFEVD